jgi:putative nucleotidyltransferase-like protein
MVPYPEENLLLRLLRGEPATPADGEGVEAARFVDLCRRHGVAAVALRRMEATGRGWPPAILDGLKRVAQKTLVDNLVLVGALHETAAALDGARIEFLLLKGVSLLGFLYPRIDERRMTDMDLLIRRTDWPAVADTLARRGYILPTPESEVELGEDWYNHEVRTPGSPSCTVEIHWDLESIERSRIDPDALFRAAVPCTVDDRPYRRLSDDHLLLHLAVHLAHHYEAPALYWVEDLRLLLKAGSLDWDRIAATADAWGVRNCLAYSLGYVERLYPGSAGEAMRRFRWSPTRRLILGALGTSNPILPHRDLERSPLRHAISMALLDRWSAAAGYISRHATGRTIRALGGRRRD